MAATSQKRSGTTDLTVGKPLFQILRFALPLVLGTLFQQLYSFADTVIVGRCLGTDALGAVGTTYSLNFLILGFVQGACVGFGIPAAETFGAKDKDGLQKYLLNGALLCLVLSVVFTVLTTLMAGPLLRLIHFSGHPGYGAIQLRFQRAASTGGFPAPLLLPAGRQRGEHSAGLSLHRAAGHGGGRCRHCHRAQPAAQRRDVRLLVLYPHSKAGGAFLPAAAHPAFGRALQAAGLHRPAHGV